jgi:hypothetical protein
MLHASFYIIYEIWWYFFSIKIGMEDNLSIKLKELTIHVNKIDILLEKIMLI